MFEWSDTDLMVRDAVRQFIDKEIRPHQDALETGELSPYPIARKLFSQFGLDVLLAESVNQMLDGERAKREKRDSSGSFGLADQASMVAVLVSELAGVSIGLLSTVGRQPRVGRGDDHEPRHPGPTGALGAHAGDAGKDRGLGHYRARLRLGCVRRHEDSRDPRR